MARPSTMRRGKKAEGGGAAGKRKKNLVTKGSANKRRQPMKPVQKKKGKGKEEEELPVRSQRKEDEIQLEDFLDFGGEGAAADDDESIASDDVASSAGSDISSLDSEAEAAFMKSIDQLGKKDVKEVITSGKAEEGKSSRKFDFMDSSGFLPEGSAAATGMEAEGGGNLLGELLKMAEDDKGKEEQKGEKAPSSSKLRKQLGLVTSSTAGVDENDNLPESVRRRADREVRYDSAKSTAEKEWMPAVHAANNAAVIDIAGEQRAKLGATQTSNTAVLSSTFQPENELEKAIAAAVKESNVFASGDKQTAEDGHQLPFGREAELKKAEERNTVARLKRLMFQEQRKNARLNKIKSKTWHKLQKKSREREQEKLLEKLEASNPEEAAKLREELEKKLSKVRLQRQSMARKKWAKAAQRFGGSDMRNEVSRQAQAASDARKELERAIKGKRQGQDDSDDSEDEDSEVASSEIEEDPVKAAVSQAKKQAEAILRGEDAAATDEAAGKGGLLGMKFMQRGVERKREEARRQAEDVLEELTEWEKQAAAAANGEEEQETTEEEDSETEEEEPSPTPFIPAGESEKLAAEAEDLLEDASAGGTAVQLEVPTPPPSVPKAGPSKKAAKKMAHKEPVQAQPEDEEGESASSASEGEEETQQDLVRSAFGIKGGAESSYAREWVEELEAKDEAERLAEEETFGAKELPGWGSGWTGAGVVEKPKDDGKKVAGKKRRRFTDVMVNEEAVGKKAAKKYQLSQVPRSIGGKTAAYEREMSRPLGPEWHSAQAHERLIQPRIITRVGEVIAPLQRYKKSLDAASKKNILEAYSERKANAPSHHRTKARICSGCLLFLILLSWILSSTMADEGVNGEAVEEVQEIEDSVGVWLDEMIHYDNLPDIFGYHSGMLEQGYTDYGRLKGNRAYWAQVPGVLELETFSSPSGFVISLPFPLRANGSSSGFAQPREGDLAGDRLAKICRHLEASGHMKGTSGCASMRFGDLALVTPSGYLKAELTGRRDLFLVCVSSGEVLEPPRNDEIPRKLTDSWEVVKMIYEKVGMSECTCVLHSHHEALALAANIEERRLSANASPLLKWRAPEDQEMLKGIRGYGTLILQFVEECPRASLCTAWLCVIGNDAEGVPLKFSPATECTTAVGTECLSRLSDTNQPLLVPIIRNTPHEKDLCPELGMVLDDTRGSPPAVLVENHGVYVWGKSWVEAQRHLECLTWLAQYAVEEAKLVRPAKIPRICRGDLVGIVLLFDVEGTTTPITFVKDTLFPLARDKMQSWLAAHWDDKEGAQVRKLLPAELQKKSSEEVAAEMKAWIAADRKEPALKTAQGLIWRESYETGALRAPMFSDVQPCWEEWQSRGARIAIFSSGSREAQKLIYKYCYDEQTPCLDMTRLISCYFDPTSVGGHSKQTPEAYQQIALSLGAAPRDIFFFTDIPGEARAAKAVGCRTAVVVREGNTAVDCVQLVEEGHQVAESFDDVAIRS
ncbi:hypothetical protein FOZ63_000026 [Perkinsus olseni]|uniref:Class II aldolase/adducin N-terminal domain-containing protein n=1 Tax=Perkinsus olseni TaxID=32597 RepID=A0A7J6S0M9_PEROL|nr:hypothetical protein FOZ63_000026 [Perkinsus olseni]